MLFHALCMQNLMIKRESMLTSPAGHVMKTNERHRPRFHGCGLNSTGSTKTRELNVTKDMVGCCNAHAICYESCHNLRDSCEAYFTQCLGRSCAESVGLERERCVEIVKALIFETRFSGCPFYLQSQKTACECHAVVDESTGTPHSDVTPGSDLNLPASSRPNEHDSSEL